MQRLIGVFAIASLAVFFAPVQIHASNTITAQIFPPATSAGGTCPSGSPQLLMWDGQHQVHCLVIPTCATYPAGTNGYPFQTSQFLQYDESNQQFKCVNPQGP